MTVNVGTVWWLVPEVLAGCWDSGPPADIYSFGAVLSELDTHAIPFDDVFAQSGEKRLPQVAIAQKVVEGTLRPSFSADCPEPLRELAAQYTAQNPKELPLAAKVHYALRSI
jgi:serine/threonine protein kinase